MKAYRSPQSHFPPAVVLDTAYSGYGVLRSLFPYGIPLIGFCHSRAVPESHTNLCDRKIFYTGEEDLLKKLIELTDTLRQKPVLILTTDFYVEFFVRNRERLDKKYLIHMPEDNIVELLLDKNKFSAFASKNNILIPKSFEVKTNTDIAILKEQVRFPVILKPFKRTPEWENAGCKKAYILRDFASLESFYHSIAHIEREVIVQEFIEGNDDHVEYCLTSFSANHECVISFTGRKLRQWPVGTGSTATTVPHQNPHIEEETVRIFKAVGYSGFGSIEYKRDENDGRYYLMEPTVGRLNQQEYVATLAGFNIPLAAYCELTGIDIKPIESRRSDIVYIDEIAEIQSVYIHLKRNLITIHTWIDSLKGKRYFRFFNLADPAVFFLGLPAKAFIKLTGNWFSRHDS